MSMNLEFNARLTYIEEVKEDLRKKYNTLKRELKENSGFDKDKKDRIVTNAKVMYEYANKHYLEIKLQAVEWRKVNLLAKQLVSSMNSVRNYTTKIYNICGIVMIFRYKTLYLAKLYV